MPCYSTALFMWKPGVEDRWTVVIEEFVGCKTTIVHYKVFNYSIFSKWTFSKLNQEGDKEALKDRWFFGYFHIKIVYSIYYRKYFLMNQSPLQ